MIMPTGQTDGGTPDRYITMSSKSGQRYEVGLPKIYRYNAACATNVSAQRMCILTR